MGDVIEQNYLPLVCAFGAGLIIPPLLMIAIYFHRLEMASGRTSAAQLAFFGVVLTLVCCAIFIPAVPYTAKLFAITLEAVVMGMIYSCFAISKIMRFLAAKK